MDYITFKKCDKCGRSSCICKKCNSCSSGNEVIDNFLFNQVTGMEFISYNKFEDIDFIAEGGFSRIYIATWIDGQLIKHNQHDRNGETIVVLKELNNSRNINSEELNELRIYCKLEINHYICKYHGITQDPISQNFMIIMDYYELGDLTHYITNNFFNIYWLNKLYNLDDIITGLENLHRQNIIHKDYHSGNIFLTDGYTITGDLGISKSAITDNNDEIYGIIPYIAPEVLHKKKYVKASDIYSFGMIMWELMTGRKPFWDQSHDTDLIIKIYDGLRPPIVSSIHVPEGYIELMKKCWHFDPEKRPTHDNIRSKIISMKENEKKNPTKVIKSSDIGPVTDKNPGAIYKSRSLSAMIKSAESTISLKSQEIDKRKFDDNLVIDKPTKKVKLFEDENDDYDYLTKEFGFDI